MPPTPQTGERAIWDEHFRTCIAAAVQQAISKSTLTDFLSTFYANQVEVAAKMATSAILARRTEFAENDIQE